MQGLIIEVMTEWGYFGTFLLIAAENLFPPIPSEVILTFAGFLTTLTPLTKLGMIFFATLGSLSGAFVLYALGRLLSEERVAILLKGKLCRTLRFEAEDVEKARLSFAQKGYWSVPICHCVPILRSLISIPAGMSKMPLPLFVVLTSLGSAVWNTALVYLGAFAGANWQSITASFASATGAVRLFLLVIVVAGIIYFMRKNMKSKQV